MRSRTSYENTKKHLDKLMSIGVIKKEAGLGAPTSKGIHPVWQYSLVPGAWNPSYGTSGFSPTHGPDYRGGNLTETGIGQKHALQGSPRETFLPSLSLAGMMMARHSF